MFKNASELRQGDEFVLASSNCIVTDPPRGTGQETVVHFAVPTLTQDIRGTIYFDDRQLVEVITNHL